MSWQKILAEGFSSSKALLAFLELPEALYSLQAERFFKTRIPRDFAKRIQPGNPHDPILLQILASPWEEESDEAYGTDSLEESKHTVLPGLLHKYSGRVLLTLTGVCAVNCRYCFRRHFPYKANNPGRQGWQKVIEYIGQDNSISEVIFSGGDPLLAQDSLFAWFFSELGKISHVHTIRFHSRVPIVLPARVTPNFLNLLDKVAARKVMVLHCNHAQEIDASVQKVCSALRAVNCHLLNQSVLLKGINDNVQVLADLSERLFDCGVLPYYLHLMDKVKGAAHFDLPFAKALKLYRHLQTVLPGYLLPRLVREEPGKGSKILVS